MDDGIHKILEMDDLVVSNNDTEHETKKFDLHLINFVLLLVVLLSLVPIGANNLVLFLDRQKTAIIEEVIPFKYSIPEANIMPPTNQSNIGSCWSFATIYMLESQYRSNGIAKGFLDTDEYVHFSEQAYFTLLGQQCKKHPEFKSCYYGGLMDNSSEDQQIETLYYFSQDYPLLTHSIVPFDVCPYRSKPDDWNETNWEYFWCPDLEAAIENNPISFRIKKIETVYNIEDTKRLLIRSNRALGFGAPLPKLRYWVPCTGSAFENSTVCESKKYPCPTEYRHDFCIPTDIDGRSRDGIFLSSDDQKFVTQLGGHAMNLVGYNDAWTPAFRYNPVLSGSRMRGGFILHNSWREDGHSVDFLMDRISIENENTICPNHRHPLSWIPATLECIQSHRPEACSTDMKRIRGHGHAKHADVLITKNSSATTQFGLNPNSTYFLRRQVSEDGSEIEDVMIEDMPGGLHRTHFIEVTEDGDVVPRHIDNLPFWHLFLLFTPKDPVENDPDVCGYWVLPYDTLEIMRNIGWSFMDNFRVVDIEVEFADQSYARSKASKAKDVSYLKASTHKMKKPTFDGPLPFNLVF